MKSKAIQYYVEGEDERKLINVLKTELRVIMPGKVQKLNVVEEKIKKMHLRTLSYGTIVVLIFDTDTDTGNLNILDENIRTLKECSTVSEIVLIPQVPNLEGELVRSCDIRKIEELLSSKSRKDFKSDLIHISNLNKKLREHQFDINLFWCSSPTPPYQDIENQAAKIKIIK